MTAVVAATWRKGEKKEKEFTCCLLMRSPLATAEKGWPVEAEWVVRDVIVHS